MFQEMFAAYRSPRKIAYLVALSVLVVLLPFGAWSLWQTREAEAGWFNANWAYRAPVAVTNPGSSSLSNFQVDFTLDTAALIAAGKMQADCADLRVTLSSGDILPHWIETGDAGCGESATRIWTRVTNIPASGTTIYAYYGNSTTTDSQDGEAVFEFFDDFSGEELDMSKWDSWSTSPYSINDGVLTLEGACNTGIISEGLDIRNVRVRARMIAASDSGLLTRVIDGANLHLLRINVGSNATDYYRRTSNTWAVLGGAYSTFGNWSIFRIVEFIAIENNFYSTLDGTSLGTVSDSQHQSGGIGLRRCGGNPSFDWVFATKAVASSDTPTSSTASEQNRPAGSVALGPISEFSPTQIEGLQLWLDAADQSTLFQDAAGTTPVMAGNDPVGRWEDKSGNNRNATQANSDNMPSFSDDSRQGVFFGSDTRYFSIPSTAAMGEFTVTMVVKLNSSSLMNPITGHGAAWYISFSNQRIRWYDGTGWRTGPTTIDQTRWAQVSYIFDNGAHYMYVDGSVE